MSGSAVQEAHAGRVALVTGAARGIGQAIAVGLAKQGATVVIGDVEDLSETSKFIARTGRSAVAATLDISDPSVIDQVRVRVADELGRVDILVNNAAIFESATRDELDLGTLAARDERQPQWPDAHVQFVPAADARAWLGARHQRRLGNGRHCQPGIDRLPCEQDGRHRVHAGAVSNPRR